MTTPTIYPSISQEVKDKRKQKEMVEQLAVKEYNEKVEYLHLNPVKAGLVARPEEWPWSNVHDYTCSVRRAEATPSGPSVDRVLLPADQNMRT